MRHPLDVTVAYHDACHLGHAQGVRAPAAAAARRRSPAWSCARSPRPSCAAARPASTTCCNPEPARELGDRKAANVVATGADVLVTANPGCLMQVAVRHREGGTSDDPRPHRRGARRLDPRETPLTEAVTSYLGKCCHVPAEPRTGRRLAGPQCVVRCAAAAHAVRPPRRPQGHEPGSRAWSRSVVALAVAIVLFEMPVDQALLAGTEGAAFGFFPILWIVINAIWVYNLTVGTGHFDVLRRSFEKVSADQRIQAIIIAFCFGALLEALAGFGTPVAITVVMLLALGLRAAEGRRGRADREHRAGRVRCAGHADRHALDRHLGRQRRPGPDRRQPRRDGRPADAAARCRGAADPGLGRRRLAAACAAPGCLPSPAASPSGSRSSSPPTTSRCRWPTSSPRSFAAGVVVLLLQVWSPSEELRAEPKDSRWRPVAAVRRVRRQAASTSTAPPPVADTPHRGGQGLRAVRRDHRDLLDRQHPRDQGGAWPRSRGPTCSSGRASTC